MVPVTTAPFLSSIVTVSFVSFIRNRTSFIPADRHALGAFGLRVCLEVFKGGASLPFFCVRG